MTSSLRAGIVVGAVLALFHLCWALLILLGWAQPLLDFVFWAHMIRPVYVVRPFDVAAAGTLILLTGVTGFIMGSVGALIWNRLHRP